MSACARFAPFTVVLAVVCLFCGSVQASILVQETWTDVAIGTDTNGLKVANGANVNWFRIGNAPATEGVIDNLADPLLRLDPVVASQSLGIRSQNFDALALGNTLIFGARMRLLDGGDLGSFPRPYIALRDTNSSDQYRLRIADDTSEFVRLQRFDASVPPPRQTNLTGNLLTGGPNFDWHDYEVHARFLSSQIEFNVFIDGALVGSAIDSAPLDFGNSIQLRVLAQQGRGLEVDNLRFASAPEPSSLAIFGVGTCVMAIGAARRRRREKNKVTTG